MLKIQSFIVVSEIQGDPKFIFTIQMQPLKINENRFYSNVLSVFENKN